MPKGMLACSAHARDLRYMELGRQSVPENSGAYLEDHLRTSMDL